MQQTANFTEGQELWPSLLCRWEEVSFAFRGVPDVGDTTGDTLLHACGKD